jgi:hypothetical protein
LTGRVPKYSGGRFKRECDNNTGDGDICLESAVNQALGVWKFFWQHWKSQSGRCRGRDLKRWSLEAKKKNEINELKKDKINKRQGLIRERWIDWKWKDRKSCR